MTAFRIIPTVKLFNLAKKARHDGYGSNQYISQFGLKEAMNWLKFIEILNLFSITEKI